VCPAIGPRFARRCGFVVEPQGQRDAAPLRIDLQHLDLDHLPGLDHAVRVLDEAMGQRGDVHEAVLVHADIDESPEVRDIGDHALEQHARRQVADRLHALAEDRGPEGRARVAAGLLELAQDVAHRGQAERVVGVARGIDAAQQAGIADDLVDALADIGQDARDERIGLGVDSRGVQGLRALAAGMGYAQESCRLLECLLAKARHFLELAPRGEGAVAVAVRDDAGGQGAVEAADARQQRRRCRAKCRTKRVPG